MNLRALYSALFWVGRDAILQGVRVVSTIQAEPGMLLVLHSGSQLLTRHLHLHIMLPAVGWSVADRDQLVTADGPEWLPIKKVMELFREKVIKELTNHCPALRCARSRNAATWLRTDR